MRRTYLIIFILFIASASGICSTDAIISSSTKGIEQQEKIIINGRVTDPNNQPLAGVNVIEKGTQNGTITGVDGNYEITVSDPGSVLVFSFMGYITKEVQVGDKITIDMVMNEDLVGLDEVVVVGYGTVKKSDVTGSVSSVGSREIEQGNVYDPLQAMQGRAAGVDITSNNRPGEFGTIRIRGERTIVDPQAPPTTANEPLYVVDGIPMSTSTRRIGVNFEGGSITPEDLTHNPISDLNPNDIASIEILKDASATAIYGSRGANGVVLITTKRGKSGKAQITYDANVTYEQLNDPMEFFGAAGQIEANREVFRSTDVYDTPYADPENDWNLLFSGRDAQSWEAVAQAYEWEDEENMVPEMRATTAEEKEMWGVDEVPVYHPDRVRETDWVDLATRTGVTQNHQIGASMGSEKMKTYISLGYLDRKGVEKGQSYTRYTAMLSMDLDVHERIRLGASMNGAVGDQEFGINTVDLARGMLPFTQPYDTDGDYDWLPGDDALIVNFMRDIDNVRNNRKSYRARASLYGEVDILKGLKYRVNFGPDFRLYRNGTFQSAETAARWGDNSYARYFQDQSFNWTLENLLYYNVTLGEIHGINITGLHAVENYKYEYSRTSAENLTYDEQLWYDLSSTRDGVALDFDTHYEGEQRESYMLRVNYSLKDRYLLTAAYRRDGASVLAPGNKWQSFPSAALAWKMQEEPFMQGASAVTESKLRVSWGATGNSNIPPYQVSGSLTNLNYSFGSDPATGYKIDNPPNADMNWERTEQFNIGYDFGFFKNRISGSIDMYNANTDNILLLRRIPVVNGSDNVFFNIGQSRNQGIEIAISSVNISTKDFSWRTDVTFSRNVNEIVELYNGKNDDVGNQWFIGEPINVNYGYVYDGIWQDTPADSALHAQYYGEDSYNRIGSIRVKDLDTTGGEHTFNSFDQTIRGSEYPDFVAGMTNYITYKGFQLSCFFYARVGHTIPKATPLLFGRYHDIAVDYWTPNNTDAIYPRPTAGNTDTYMSSLGYQKGSFLKVRNISLVYNLPTRVLSNLNMSSMAIKVQVLNPFLFTEAENTDPDLGNNPTRSLVAGINVGF